MVNPFDLQQARLIGLDWGSTSLRAMLMDAQGRVLSARQSAQGASTLDGSADAFCAALDALIADWRAPGLPILACGMVGSQHGWREVPYAACPVDAAALAAAALAVDWHGQPVRILPGLRCESRVGVPDVMRGEETQVVGALSQDPSLAAGACIVMPGTHSKWAQVLGGAVHSFATHMTGELFAVLRQHSVLGRMMPAQPADDAPAFEAGVRAAHEDGEQGLTHQLFAVRTLALMGRLDPHALPDYLSGLLIGHELRAGLRWQARAGLDQAPLLLIGEPALCQRYANALALFATRPADLMANTAALGLWQLAQVLPERM